MNARTPHVYKFDDFQLDADRLALYHRGVLIREAERKSLEVLAALLRKPNELVTHEEVIEQVWHDNLHGATAPRINQYISKLQKVFSKYSPDRKYIENVKGRGYMFTGKVDSGESEGLATNHELQLGSITPEENGHEKIAIARTGGSFLNSKYVLVVLGLVLLAIAAWVWYPKNDEEAVKRVVKDSQIYESLVLYKNPSSFNEADLDKYWTAELDVNSNFDRGKIKEAVRKMVDEGRRYGDETKCEQFDFQTVDINRAGDMAAVKTLEKWFVAVYQTDGTLLRNRTIGPYFVNYTVRKIGGRWLIEKSTTGRIARPAPRLSEIEAISEMKAGQQFFAKITGQDFEAETIYLEIIGPGCPDSKPCKIPNDVLREKSKLTETTLDNIPFTLASGDFRIVAHNGESQASNPVYLKIP